MDDLALRSAHGPELTAAALYAILSLRAAVFVVEQHCPYLDPDGLDLAPDTRHLWLAEPTEPDRPLAYVRVLAEPPDGHRIGRVVTAPDQRGRRLAARLLGSAVEGLPGTVRLAAQSHLVDYYATFGFRVEGPEFLEDGIPHTPMRR